MIVIWLNLWTCPVQTRSVEGDIDLWHDTRRQLNHCVSQGRLVLLHNKHVDSLLQGLRNGHVYDLLSCVLLQTLLRDDLRDADTWLSNLEASTICSKLRWEKGFLWN